MTQSSNQGYIGIGSQTTQKTTAVTPSQYIQYLSDDIAPEIDSEILAEGGDGKYSVSSVKTQHREKIGFSFYARPKVSAQLYAALLGNDTPSHLTTTPFYHTIIPKTTEQVQPWLTVEKMLVSTTNSRVHRITGAKISAITLEAEAGMPVTQTVEGTGITGALRTTSNSPTYETGNPFSFYHGVYHVNQPTTTNFDIKSFSLKISSENDEAIQTTALTRRDIINLKWAVEMTLGLVYNDYTMFAKANYNAGTTVSESFSDGSINLILKTNAGTTSERRLAINIPKVRLEAHQLPLNPAAETLEQPLSGIGLKQSTTELVTVTAYNTIATTLPT